MGLVVATAGLFGAHSTASGWTGRGAPVGKAQASSLYNLFYYNGSSAIGWLGGVAFDAYGWTAVAAVPARDVGAAQCDEVCTSVPRYCRFITITFDQLKGYRCSSNQSTMS
jgi:hypothetical protein